MKIIDLINKIANGEEVPKKIKYCYKEFVFTGYDSASKNYNSKLEDLFEVLDGSMLNDEVEILEEEKKIPEKLKDILRVDDLIPPVDENMYKIWKQTIKNQNKINEICDYLKSKGDE